MLKGGGCGASAPLPQSRLNPFEKNDTSIFICFFDLNCKIDSLDAIFLRSRVPKIETVLDKDS